jgi:hypothetical protein
MIKIQKLILVFIILAVQFIGCSNSTEVKKNNTESIGTSRIDSIEEINSIEISNTLQHI